MKTVNVGGFHVASRGSVFVNWTSGKRIVAVAMLVTLIVISGCAKQQTGSAPPPVVKVIEVRPQRVPLPLEFVGQVEALNEVQVRTRVSGQIVKRYVSGGQYVKQGQALFQIDPQVYEMNVLDAGGQLADAEAAMSRNRQNLARLEKLLTANAISQQQYDNALAEDKQLAARVHSAKARLSRAELDLKETLVLAPIEGQMDTSNLSVGNYVQQGVTVLVTLSAPDPVLVRFSLSENEYLRLVKSESTASSQADSHSLQIALEDGSVYPFKGKVVQSDRGLASGTGTLTLKAQFPNPKGLLLPGMFARVQAIAETRSDAILVPQRAVQDLMGKSMITVVGDGDKAEMRAVTTGPRIGRLWLVEEGLNRGERIVVDGVQKVRPGEIVKAETVSIEQYTNTKAK